MKKWLTVTMAIMTIRTTIKRTDNDNNNQNDANNKDKLVQPGKEIKFNREVLSINTRTMVNSPTVSLRIGDIWVRFVIDSGLQCTCVTQETYELVKQALTKVREATVDLRSCES